MENRLHLNKKPVYKLPDEIIIDEFKRGSKTPTFEPDLVINNWGQGRFCSFGEKSERACQLWIKTDNDKLIDFIKNYDFKSVVKSASSPHLTLWQFKKVLLEEYYGK